MGGETQESRIYLSQAGEKDRVNQEQDQWLTGLTSGGSPIKGGKHL
jgi:hypothetical protein